MNKEACFCVLCGLIALAPHMTVEWAIGYSIGCVVLAAFNLYAQYRRNRAGKGE